MSAPSPSDPNATTRKWLPWVIGLVVLLFLAWWMRGCGKAPEMGVMADTTQSMMAPDSARSPAPAPAPVETATPAPADTSTVKGSTSSGPRIKDSPRTDTAAPVPPAPAEPTGPGAMGGQGAPGKAPPPTKP